MTIIQTIIILFAGIIIGDFLCSFIHVLEGKNVNASGNAKKLVREALRAKYISRGNLGTYALNVSPAGIRVARARDHQFALLAGVEDFWELVPVHAPGDKYIPISALEHDLIDGDSCLSCIDDGSSKTFVAGARYVVPNGYSCTRATPEEIRDVIDYAKNKPGNGYCKGKPVKN